MVWSVGQLVVTPIFVTRILFRLPRCECPVCLLDALTPFSALNFFSIITDAGSFF